jgi:hypothetical protein
LTSKKDNELWGASLISLGNLSLVLFFFLINPIKQHLETIFKMISFSLTPVKGKYFCQNEALTCLSRLAKSQGNTLLPHMKKTLRIFIFILFYYFTLYSLFLFYYFYLFFIYFYFYFYILFIIFYFTLYFIDYFLFYFIFY